MSREFDPKPQIPRRRKAAVDPYTAKIPKERSKQRREDALRHAVNHRDVDAFEDYDDEHDF